MKSSYGPSRIIQLILSVTSWISITSGFVIAAPNDPAPIPDEVIQKVVRNPRARRTNPLPEILRQHLDGTSALLKDVEKIDRDGGDTHRQESSPVVSDRI